MVKDVYVSGKILTINGFKNGFINLNSEKPYQIQKGVPPSSPIKKGLIVTSFCNAHTHIGDTFIRSRDVTLPNNIEQLVAPPDGLKHRLLKEASEKEIKQGMNLALNEMTQAGIDFFCDFRENGINGAKTLKLMGKHAGITPIIYGRPENLDVDKKEILELIKIADGIGLSSISDWKTDNLEIIANYAKKHNTSLALHASERIREDIDFILSLEPTFLVHMTQGTKKDFEKIKQQNIPVVICPRSNAFFGYKPPLQRMKKTGIELLIGTDNAMLHSLKMQDEIHFIQKQFPNMFSLESLLAMTTILPRKVLNLKDGMSRSTFPTSFLVLDTKTLEPIFKSKKG